MRLIDADELWEKMYKYNDNEGAKMPYGDDDSLIHKDSACFLIENAPTIEPERQKGEWIDCTQDGYVECPFCHSATNCDGNKDELHFCFSCGADLKGEKE